MRILFWGTPAFAVPSLRALDDEGFEIVGVVTQPDRPAGRGRRLRPSPIKEVALEAGFEILTPDRPRTDDFVERIRALKPDISVVVAYGHILKPFVLDVPRMGSINVHASLLPELRGAAPINWAIARGHEKTGITIMRMAEGMDAGAIIHQVEEPILPDETAGDLTLRLSEVGAAALVEALALMSVGQATEEEQDHERATFAPKIDRKTAHVDWARPARRIAHLVRAMDPIPGAWTTLDDGTLKLFRPSIWSETELGDAPFHLPATNGGDPIRAEGLPPGTVLAADAGTGLLVRAGDGAVAFTEVQPPGKKRMRTADWVNGRGVDVGAKLG